MEKRKPTALVHDPVRGGASLESIKTEECPDDLRRSIFQGQEVITWHRIKDFQLVSLKLLAEKLLLGCTSYQRKSVLPLFVPGEIATTKLTFRRRVVLYASPNNPGADAVAQRIRKGSVGIELSQTPATSDGDGAPPGATHMLLYLAHATYLGKEGERLAEELRRARASQVSVVMVRHAPPLIILSHVACLARSRRLCLLRRVAATRKRHDQRRL